MRNTDIDYSALSELYGHFSLIPGATRLTLFGACPWLSYSAPSALELALAFIFRAFGAGACPWLSYSAPLALSRKPN